MKKSFKSILSLVLCFVMLVGMVAVGGGGFVELIKSVGIKASAANGNVCQIGSTEYATLQAAIDTGSAGDTIEMIANAQISDSVTFNKNMTLDLKGYSIEMAQGSGYSVISIMSGTLTLRDSSGGNKGHITGGSATNGGGIYIYGGGTLVMDDVIINSNSANNLGGGVYVDDNAIFTMLSGSIEDNSAPTGGGVYVAKGGTFNMTGTSGGSISENQSPYGAGVYVLGGTFTMDKGTISSNSNGETGGNYGGGIYGCENAMITIKGGTIENNTATCGGGICNNGSAITMTAGSVSGNNAEGGAGAYIEDGTFTMTGGSISSNTATENGGGVLVGDDSENEGKFIFSGGDIQGNSAKCGGGIYNLNGEVNMGSATISSNLATAEGSDAKGGGIYNNADGLLIITNGILEDNEADEGGAIFNNGALTIRGGTVTGNSATSGGGIKYGLGSLTLSELVTVYGNTASDGENLLVADGDNENSNLIAVGLDGLDEGSLIGISCESTPTSSASVAISDTSGGRYIDYFFSDNDDYIIINEGGALKLSLPDDDVAVNKITGRIYETVQSAVNSATNGDTIALLRNKKERITITGKSITLDLNGHTLNGNKEGTVITIDEDAGLTLEDSSESGRGIIKGGFATQNTDYAGGVYIGKNASFVMNGGNIINNEGYWSGGVYIDEGASFIMNGGSISSNSGMYGGVYFNSGSFTMNGGKIENNSGISTGAVSGYNGTFNMYDGEITGNTGFNYGAIYLSQATFNMFGGSINGNSGASFAIMNPDQGAVNIYGGSITDNINSGSGGGILTYGTSTIAIRSYPSNYEGTKYPIVITNNTGAGTTANVCLKSGITITVYGEPLADSRIGVSTEDAPDATTDVAFTGENAADYENYFFSDNSNYRVINDSNVLKLTLRGDNVAENVDKDYLYESVQEAVNHAAPGDTIKLIYDVTETVTVSNKEITLDLNGNTLTCASGSPALTVSGSGELTLIDSTASSANTNGLGSVTGGAANNCAVLVNGTNAYFTMTGGTISYNSGYGIKLQNGYLTINGGSFENNDSYGIYVTGGYGTMNGGNISNNENSGIYLIGGSFIMNGGEIKSNTATNGAGVYSNGGSFNMTGGLICGNNASNNGGGIWLGNGSSYFAMTGGKITGNLAKTNGAGVYFSQGNVLLGGSAYIEENFKTDDESENNLYIGSGNTVSIDEDAPFTSGASIGVSSLVKDVITSNGVENDCKYFTSDDNKYFVDYYIDEDDSEYNGLTLAEDNTAYSAKFVARNLTLSDSIAVNYKATISGYTDYYVEFSIQNGETREWATTRISNPSASTYSGGDCFKFSFKGVNPQRMNDNISATLYGKMKSGNVVAIQTDENYSIRQYILNVISKDENSDWYKLLSNLVAFGSSAQVIMNYETNNLVSEYFNDVDNYSPVINEKSDFENLYKETESDGGVDFTSIGLDVSSSVLIRVRFELEEDDIEDVVIKAKIGDDPVQTLEIKNDGKYYVELPGVYAANYGDLITFTCFVNGVEKDNLEYSVNSYLLNHYDDDETTFPGGTFTKAMLSYGYAANEIKNK